MSETDYLGRVPASHGEAWSELSNTVCKKTGDTGCVLIDSVKSFLHLRGREHQQALVEIAATEHSRICSNNCPYHSWANYGKEEYTDGR